jgi:biopolymer transport protein ExbB
MWELIDQGGPLMWPLLLCSWLTIAVLIDRAWAFFSYSQVDRRSLRSQVLDLLREGRVADAALLCANTPGPVSAVVLAGLQSFARHSALKRHPEVVTGTMEKAMEDYAEHAVSAVQKRLSILATIGTAAPLLGFTGTVTGMIKTFMTMWSQGTAAQGVALGISEALITTASGLIIALAAVIPYNVFVSMADKIELEISESKTELVDFVATQLATEAPEPEPEA